MTNPTPHGQVPEALRLAALLDADEWPGSMSLVSYARACVAELLRLHAENQVLRTTHVQSPTENEHVAGDVWKNGVGSNMGAAYAELPDSLICAVDQWFADNIKDSDGCTTQDVRELAEIFYGVTHEGGRESVDDALAIVKSFGPGIGGINDTYARQVLLAEEVERLRGQATNAKKTGELLMGLAVIRELTGTQQKGLEETIEAVRAAVNAQKTSASTSQPGGFDAGDMASAAAQGYRDGWAAAQAISAEPTPDELRAIAREARNSSGSASDDCGSAMYVLYGWRAAISKVAPPVMDGGEVEDAARYQLVRRGQHWSVIDGIGNDLRAEALDAAVDAIRVSHGQAPAQPVGPCAICGSDEPFTGTCGSGDPRALCKQPSTSPQAAQQAPAKLVEAVTKAILFEDTGSIEGWEENTNLGEAAIRVCDARNPPRCSYCHSATGAPLAAPPTDSVTAPVQSGLVATMLDALRHAQKVLNHNNLHLECGPVNAAILAARAPADSAAVR